MNTALTNANFDHGGTGGPPHYPHKLNEFKAANSVAFWDSPMTGTVGEAGVAYGAGANKADPSSNGTDRPIVSGRHTSLKGGGIPQNDQTFYLSVSGGVPVSFLDGHAEMWSLPTFHDNLNEAGGDAGPSAIWVAPGDPKGRGGWDGGTNRAMGDLLGSN
jgi:prepilin-type processing-associated H-X9-DG protein